MKQEKKKISRFCINAREITSLTQALIKKETVNPPGNEYLVKDIIMESLKKLGAKITIVGKSKRPNILGEIGKGSPRIAIISHMDVVPPGEGWNHAPFKPLVRGGKIYGRGAIDNKGPYAASWAAVKAVVETGLPHKGTIILGAVSDEERGSEEGMHLLLAKGFHPDFCLIPDGGRINEAVIGEKGMLWIKLISQGKQAHALDPSQGINAIEKLSKFILRLKNIDFGKGYHPRFTKTTLNWGKVSGGQAPNIVPGRCEATLDIRYPLGLKKQDILKRIREEIQIFQRQDKHASIKIKEVLFETKPHLTKESSPFVQSFLQSARKNKLPLTLKAIGGNSVAKELHFAEIPALAHSPEEGTLLAHQVNESVKITNLVKCARLWATFLEKLTA